MKPILTTQQDFYLKSKWMDYMKVLGVSYSNSYEFFYNKKCFPRIAYNAELDSFMLYFNGPQGFGKQSFFFDYVDFVAAYEDSKSNHSKPKDERYSFPTLFLGPNWFDNEKLSCVALILFCFNLTPTFLRKTMQRQGFQSLKPKQKHCQILPFFLPLNWLELYLQGNYVQKPEKRKKPKKKSNKNRPKV